MDSISVAISNWPGLDVAGLITLVIAVVAVLVSLYTACLGRESTILNSRPYVWAGNYVVLDSQNNRLIPQPDKLMFHVHNSPAHVTSQTVQIRYGGKVIFEHCEENFVRFPDAKSEWYFGFGQKEHTRIMNQPDPDRLERQVHVLFSAIGGKRRYRYFLRQKFSKMEDSWRNVEETTN